MTRENAPTEAQPVENLALCERTRIALRGVFGAAMDCRGREEARHAIRSALRAT